MRWDAAGDMRSNREGTAWLVSWLEQCRGWEKNKEEKSWSKRLGSSCVSAVPSLHSAVDSFDCEHEGRKPNPAGHMKSGSQFVSVHHLPISVLLPPAHTHKSLSPNLLLLQLSNIIIFHQVAFCSASVSCSTLLTSFLYCFFFPLLYWA